MSVDETPLERLHDLWLPELERWARGQLALADLEQSAAHRGGPTPDELRRRYPGLAR